METHNNPSGALLEVQDYFPHPEVEQRFSFNCWGKVESGKDTACGERAIKVFFKALVADLLQFSSKFIPQSQKV